MTPPRDQHRQTRTRAIVHLEIEQRDRIDGTLPTEHNA